MIGRLVEDNKGKPKIIRGSMVANLNSFFQSFEERDLFNDQELRELIEQAKAVVNDVHSPMSLRCNDSLRQRVTDEMTRLKSEIDRAIQDMPRRKIRMDTPQEEPEFQEAA